MLLRELIDQLLTYSENPNTHVVVEYPNGKIGNVTNLYDIVGDLHRTIVIQSE